MISLPLLLAREPAIVAGETRTIRLWFLTGPVIRRTNCRLVCPGLVTTSTPPGSAGAVVGIPLAAHHCGGDCEGSQMPRISTTQPSCSSVGNVGACSSPEVSGLGN